MSKEKNRDALVVEYEWLRHFGRELDMQADLVNARLVNIERRLADDDELPGDLSEVDERR